MAECRLSHRLPSSLSRCWRCAPSELSELSIEQVVFRLTFADVLPMTSLRAAIGFRGLLRPFQEFSVGFAGGPENDAIARRDLHSLLQMLVDLPGRFHGHRSLLLKIQLGECGPKRRIRPGVALV